MAEQENKFQHEADFLAAVLEHDGTPENMHDYISDLVLEIAGDVTLYTPEVLRVAWPLIRQQEDMGAAGLFKAVTMALRTFGDEEADKVLSEIVKAEREEGEAGAEGRRTKMTNKAERQTLKQRAQAIIDDPRRYDPDTRHAGANVLEREGPDLAEYVRRAERGDTILDLVKPLEGAPEQAAPAEANPCPKCQDHEKDLPTIREWNIDIANQLADFMESPGIAMDVWDFVGSSLEQLAGKCEVGFFTPEVIRAGLPIILEHTESRDMVVCLLEAVEKRRQQDARIISGKEGNADE